jgi:hypothetical protein
MVSTTMREGSVFKPFITLTPHIGEIFQVLVQFFPPLTAITANLNNAKGVDAVSLSFFSGVRRMSIAPYLVSFL